MTLCCALKAAVPTQMNVFMGTSTTSREGSLKGEQQLIARKPEDCSAAET